MSETFTTLRTVKLTVVTCGSCDVQFAMPSALHDKHKQRGTHFWCPNGHKIAYAETENDRLKRKLASAEGNARYYAERLSTEERRTAAFKGQVTRLKNRAAAGVCPCCDRTFQNLARHMKSQHPDFPEASDD